MVLIVMRSGCLLSLCLSLTWMRTRLRKQLFERLSIQTGFEGWVSSSVGSRVTFDSTLLLHDHSHRCHVRLSRKHPDVSMFEVHA